MKKLLVISIFCFTVLTSFSQYQVGTGLIYGSEVDRLGLQARGLYSFTKQWRVSAALSLFSREKNESPQLIVKTGFTSLDLDGHYLIEYTDEFSFYPVAGLNFSTVRVIVDDKVNNIKNKTSDTEIGFNTGIGSQYKMNQKISAFGEIKYTWGDFDQLCLFVGVLIDMP